MYVLRKMVGCFEAGTPRIRKEKNFERLESARILHQEVMVCLKT